MHRQGHSNLLWYAQVDYTTVVNIFSGNDLRGERVPEGNHIAEAAETSLICRRKNVYDAHVVWWRYTFFRLLGSKSRCNK